MEYFTTLDYLERTYNIKKNKEENRHGCKNNGKPKNTGMHVPGLYKSPRRSPRIPYNLS
jgi:hypothetical protein